MKQHIPQTYRQVDKLGEEYTGATVMEHTHMGNLSHHGKNTVVGLPRGTVIFLTRSVRFDIIRGIRSSHHERKATDHGIGPCKGPTSLPNYHKLTPVIGLSNGLVPANYEPTMVRLVWPEVLCTVTIAIDCLHAWESRFMSESLTGDR
jgi:hypothetical protein